MAGRAMDRCQSKARTPKPEVFAHLVPKRLSSPDGVSWGDTATGVWGAQSFLVRAAAVCAKSAPSLRQTLDNEVDLLFVNNRRKMEAHLAYAQAKRRSARGPLGSGRCRRSGRRNAAHNGSGSIPPTTGLR